MPIYEYQCNQCKQRLEVIQNLSDPAARCPSCDVEMRKLLSAPAIQFKGSGFYKTDYPSSSSSAASSGSRTESSSSSSESKSETTAAPAKSDAKSD
jgi:putative FmdB family regulatory protein